MSDSVFVGVPTYNGQLDFATASNALGKTSRRPKYVSSASSSLLAMGFNILWCGALNNREKLGLKWFAMLHADIVPSEFWADELISEAEKFDADVMSAVVPIKNNEGITSTGMSDPNDDFRPYCRLTQTQINHSTFPDTFDAGICSSALRALPGPMKVMPPAGSRLIVNTGCFVARIDRPWAEQVFFTIRDHIRKDEDGNFLPCVSPEDWQFSRDVAALGGKVMATRKVKLVHKGMAEYSSAATWGLRKDHLIPAA